MSLKDFAKSIPAQNGRVNFELYRLLSRGRREFEKTLEWLGEVDSIEDVGELKRFRAEVEAGKRFYTTDANWSNSIIYGIWDALFGDVEGVPLYRMPAIEHGLIFPAQQFTDTLYTARPALVTFGDYRYQVLRSKTDRPIFTVGPYISYAKPYYDSDKIAKLRQRNGRTLLVFPAHSTDAGEVTREQDDYISQIVGKAKAFDTVIVNAFWWNLNDPLIERLAAEGFAISSAGFRDDVRFLSRLRSLIELSDLVVGDDVGTHVGYALALGVPYCQISSGTEVQPSREIKDTEVKRLRAKKARLGGLFPDGAGISQEQLDACEPYWGFSHLRSRSELQLIGEISAYIGELDGDWRSGTRFAAERVLAEYEASSPRKYALLRAALA